VYKLHNEVFVVLEKGAREGERKLKLVKNEIVKSPYTRSCNNFSLNSRGNIPVGPYFPAQVKLSRYKF